MLGGGNRRVKGSVGVPDDRLSYVTSSKRPGNIPDKRRLPSTTTRLRNHRYVCSAPIRISLD